MAEHRWPSEQVIDAAQRGDVESICAVVQGAHPHVQRFARTLCGSPQDAEDAAQEALIILYRKIGTLRASGALAGWMFRIVRNECLRRIRLRPQDGPEPEREAPSAEQEVLDRLEADRIARAISVLPDTQRRVLIMRDVQGHPGSVVAAQLGLSTAAMKSQLHRARAAVQRSLG
jgi:RNA polymerase sigma factor (sigma-70 family)